MFICHGNGWLFLQSGNLGAGELWFIIPTINKGFFTIRCFGSEKGFGLENGEGQLQLMCNYGDLGEMWHLQHQWQMHWWSLLKAEAKGWVRKSKARS